MDVHGIIALHYSVLLGRCASVASQSFAKDVRVRWNWTINYTQMSCQKYLLIGLFSKCQTGRFVAERKTHCRSTNLNTATKK